MKAWLKRMFRGTRIQFGQGESLCGCVYVITKVIHASPLEPISLNSLVYSLPYVSVKSLSRVRLFATPWTVAYQAPPSMGFSRQEYWSGLPFPSPGDLPNPGIEPRSPALQVTLPSEPPGKLV